MVRTTLDTDIIAGDAARPVAILISVEEFEKLRSGNVSFASASDAFRSTVDLTQAGIEPELFEGLRDASPGREMRR